MMTWKALPVGQVAPVGGFVMQGCTWDFFGIDGPVSDGLVFREAAPQEIVQKVHGHRVSARAPTART